MLQLLHAFTFLCRKTTNNATEVAPHQSTVASHPTLAKTVQRVFLAIMDKNEGVLIANARMATRETAAPIESNPAEDTNSELAWRENTRWSVLTKRLTKYSAISRTTRPCHGL